MRNRAESRVALLGAGYIAEWHAKAIRSIPGISLVAVCDKSRARAEACAQQFGIPRTLGDIAEMADDPGIDAVHVLLPPDLHCFAAKELLDAGKHVLLEKPMCLSPAQCQELAAVAVVKGLRLGVGHNFLFHPAYEQLRRDLRDGRLGWVDQITITWNKELPQLRHGPFGIWMLREPGNLVLELGSHAFSHVVDLVGAVGRMAVHHGNPISLPSGVTIPQRWQILCEHERTAVTINLSFVPGFSEYIVHARGSLGSATADLDRNTYVLRTHSAKPDDFDRHTIVTREAKMLLQQANRGLRDYVLSKFIKRIPGNVYGHSIAQVMRAFYGDAADERISAQSGAKVMGLCCRTVAEARLPAMHQTPRETNVVAAVNPTVLVLGATGFIGQALVRKLVSDGHTVRVLVRDPAKLPPSMRSPNLDIMRGDLENDADLPRSMKGIQYVYHLARAMVKTWPDYQKYDIQITDRVAAACLESGVKLLIYTGTIDSYYAGAAAGTISEDTPLDPNIERRNLYARAKAVSEGRLMQMHRERKLPVVIFRPGIVIGSGGGPMHWGVGMWHHGSVCQVWGDGHNKLPLVLVEDVASGLAAAIGREDIAGKSFNLIGDPCLAAREYLDEVERHGRIRLDREFVAPWRFYALDMVKWVVKCMVRHPDRRMPTYRDWESRTQRASFDCSETKRVLQWNPETRREEMIRRGIHVPLDELMA